MEVSTVIINVAEVLRRARIKPGDAVADLGTGREGKIAIPAGQIVGENGVAYAVDVVKTILPAVQTKAKMRGVNNIQTVWSDLEMYGATRAIRDNSLDIGFLVTVLFQSTKHADIIKEAHRMVRPGGRLVVVDWKPGAQTPVGPPAHMRVHPEAIQEICKRFAMQLQDTFEAGPYHWGLIFVK